MSLFYKVIVALLLPLPVLAQAPAPEEDRLVYTDRPLLLSLQVEHEHRVVFPEPVHIDVPSRLMSVLTSLQPDQQAVYWTAGAEFPAQRVIATAVSGERVYLLDLSANEQAPAADYRIEHPTLAAQRTEPEAPGTEPANPPQVELLRHAAQSLYAPKRLMPSDPAIRLLSAPDYPDGIELIRSSRGEYYRYRLVAIWRGFGRYLTAIEVINQSDLLVELDPRLVQGQFEALAFQHTWLAPAGAEADRTTLYLISRNPFDQSARELAYEQ